MIGFKLIDLIGTTMTKAIVITAVLFGLATTNFLRAEIVYEEDFSEISPPKLPAQWYSTEGAMGGEIEATFESIPDDGDGGCLQVNVDTSGISNPQTHWWAMAIVALKDSLNADSLADYRLRMKLKSSEASGSFAIIRVVAGDQGGKELGRVEFQQSLTDKWTEVDLNLEEGSITGDFALNGSSYSIMIGLTRPGYKQAGSDQPWLKIDDVGLELVQN